MAHGHGNHHHKKNAEATHAEDATSAVIEDVKKETPAQNPEPASAVAAPPVLAADAGMRDHYEHWVLTHSSVARNIETALYIAPQLVPKKFSDPEVATQCGYSMVGLLGLYHDYILYKAAHVDPMSKGDNLTRLVRVPLSLVSHVQVLAEVTARKFGGEVSRWRLIVWVELFKSLCKVLLLLLQRRNSLLIGAGKYKTIHPPGTKKSPFARFSKSNQKPGARTGKVFGAKKAEEEATDKSADDASTGPTAITFDEPAFAAPDVRRGQVLFSGELLHIFRPVAYAVLRQRKGEDSWLPAVMALLMETSGLVLSASAFQDKGLTASTKLVQAKKAQDELASRKMALLLYLLRDPVYAKFTKPGLDQVCGVTDYVPVFGKFFRLVSVGILDYYYKFHFYTSAS